MDPRIWKNPLSRLLKGKAIEVVETPELYLKLTKRCEEQVNRLCLARGSLLPKFNQEQCKYLAMKLQLAIQSANSIIKDVNKEFLSLTHPEEMEQYVEIFKLLNIVGMEVEGFIQNCCKEEWMQSAIMLTHSLELVATIGLNLEFCTNIFFAKQSQRRAALTHFDAIRNHEVEVQIVKEKVGLDGMKLIMDLRNVIQSNASSSAEWQLATFLLGRLETTILPQDNNLPRSQERFLPLMIMNLQQLPDCLGKGAFGSVYKALWFGVEVAKKTFYGPSSADFLQEASILEGLHHPNIVSLFWSMTDEKRCHLVMELMDGDLFSLMHQRMEENGNQGSPFNIQEALDLILQIGEGMFYLHEKRVVHRDLKSHNILIRCAKMAKTNMKYLQVKVSDFGLSRTKEKSTTYYDMSMNIGTTRWMASEMMRVGSVQSDDVDEVREVTLNYPFKIDIYSFGMVCYEILTGEVPFSNLNHGEVKKAVLSGDRPPLPRKCPDQLRTLIESCWSAKARTRPSFGSICEELRVLKYANLQKYWKALMYRCPLKDIVTIDELVVKLSSPILEIQESATNVIHLLAKKSFDHRIYMKEQEVVPLLVLLYYSEYYSRYVREHAIATLRALSIDDQEDYQDVEEDTFNFQIESFKDLSVSKKPLCSAIRPIVEVLKSDHMKARENAIHALVKLSFDLGFIVNEEIRNSGVVPILVTFLEDKLAKGKEYAAILLFRTCCSFQDYANVIKAGIISPLMSLITQQSDGIIVFQALSILSTLAEDHEGLCAIATFKPTSILVKIIASNSRQNKDSAVEILLKLYSHNQQFIKEAKESNVIEHLTLFAQYPRGPPPKAKDLLQLLQELDENLENDL